MPDLTTSFAGIPLRSPVVAASAPPTESVSGALRCAEMGAGAVIIKSAAPISARERGGGRRTYVDSRGLWAQGAFGHETLTIDEGARIVEAVRKGTDTPVIASVGTISLNPDDFAESCLVMHQAGASAVQMDLFYVPQPRASARNLEAISTALAAAQQRVPIPVMPKLNIDFPVGFAIDWLPSTQVAGVLLLDSVRTPPPIDVAAGGNSRIPNLEGAKECSLFGGWQLPLTNQYANQLSHALRIDICAGGGMWTGADCLGTIMLGARCVQLATAIMKRGYEHIRTLNRQIAELLDEAGLPSLDAAIGLAQTHMYWDRPERFVDSVARIDESICTQCGRCTRIAICGEISLVEGRVAISDHCIGCGYCVTECPFDGALVMEAR